MKILTRYLFKEILHYCWLFLSMFVVIMLVNVIYDQREDFMDKNPGWVVIVKLLLYSLPALLALVLPMIGLLSAIFSYGLLAKNREVLAMVAAGVSFRRLALPALIFGLGLTVFTFWFNESVVPASQDKVRAIELVHLKGKNPVTLTSRKNLFTKGKEDTFYFVERYDSETARKEMAYPDIMISNADGSGLAERIQADRARLVTLPGEGGAKPRQVWELTDAEHWRFGPDGGVVAYERRSEPYHFELESNLDKFLTRMKKPEEMNFPELRAYIGLLAGGGQANAPLLRSLNTALQQKLAFPVGCLLMTLLGFAVVADVHARRFARGVSLGLLVAVGYYVINALGKSLGEGGGVGPIVAGWLPIAAFAVIVALLFARMDKIRG